MLTGFRRLSDGRRHKLVSITEDFPNSVEETRLKVGASRSDPLAGTAQLPKNLESRRRTERSPGWVASKASERGKVCRAIMLAHAASRWLLQLA